MEETKNSVMTKKEKLSNFWYYHKWHTIVALFLIFTIVICSTQMCTKTSYDIHIMYAGPHEFRRTASNGDLPPYVNAITSLKQFADDYNEDGELSIDFLDLYLLSSAEMQEASKDNETELNYALLNNNKETFSNNLMYSDFYVCILSSSLYELNKTVSEVNIFTSLEKYLDAGTQYLLGGVIKSKSQDGTYFDTGMDIIDHNGLVFYDSSAVYLSSTPLASLPEFSNLPSNTLLCLRMKSAIASHFGKEETERIYKNSESYIQDLLNHH